MGTKPCVILPIENQVRELDAKLLLACVAAERGMDAVLGYRTQLDFSAGSLPVGVYLSKSMTPKSARMFRILRWLGHRVAVWDEEALVYLSPEHYYARRMAEDSLQYVSLLFAWGRDNEQMFRKFPGYSGIPIRVVGNPRMDLLRPELRAYFDAAVRGIRERYGRYVLINTNFSMVNGFLDSLNLLRTPREPGAEPELGAAGIGTSREFAAGFSAHKQALFAAFRDMLPTLAERLPDRVFVLRPHPSEDPGPWLESAERMPNVHVVGEGNVIPWLLASDVLVHNGCTTAVEAAVLGVPSVSYRPVQDELYDFDLPNGLGVECRALEALIETLAQQGVEPDHPVASRLEGRVTGLTGRLACERIVDDLMSCALDPEGPSRWSRVRGRLAATRRALVKRHIKARVPGHRNNPDFQLHRYPEVSLGELEERVALLGRVLGRFDSVRVHPLDRWSFLLRSAEG